jgi:hypothetical protein
VHKDELRTLRTQYAALVLPPNWGIQPVSTDDGWTAKMQDYYGWGLCGGADWIGALCDDFIPETDCWDVKLVDRAIGWNLVVSNDDCQMPKRLHGAGVFSKPLVDTVGYFTPPGMRHLFFDDLWETLSMDTGCTRVAMDIVVRHDEAPQDSDDASRKFYTRENWDHDVAIFRAWKHQDYPLAAARITALMAGYGVRRWT